jgi:hypothetical protein
MDCAFSHGIEFGIRKNARANDFTWLWHHAAIVRKSSEIQPLMVAGNTHDCVSRNI